jgi:acetyl-CoA C-acetyltransferase
MRPVAIVGAHTERQSAFSERRLEEVIFDTVAAALEDAGMRRADLDSVVLGASDELDGRSISSMLTVAPAGGLLKDEMKTTSSGLHALILSAMRLQSGLFDAGIAVSWSKSSEASVAAVQWTALDPFIERDIGLIDPIATAIMAGAYLAHFHRDARDLDARAAIKWTRARHTGMLTQWDSNADRRNYVAFPLRQEHLAPIVDGVAAVVLASPRLCESRRLRHPPIWVCGIGWATDSYALAERTLWAWPALQRAARDALNRAGCRLDDITRYEVDDYSVIHEVLAVEAIGLAQPGTGFDYLTGDGAAVPPVNRGGGGFTGYPLVCGGLCRVAEVFHQLIADDQGQRVLVHETNGIAAQGHAVALLAR